MDDLMDRNEGVPEIELYVKGGGFELSRNVFRLNAFGDVFAAEDLHVGEEFNRDVVINKNGVQIPLEIRMKYRLAR